MNFASSVIRSSLCLLFLILIGCASSPSPPKEKKVPELVWPSPPDPPRIQFIQTITSNRDMEGRTKRNLKEILLGIDPNSLAVSLKRPMDVTTDSQGRILVTDAETVGIHVYDLKNHTFTLYGTKGMGALTWPMGIDVDGQDRIYVADRGAKKVMVYAPDGDFLFAIKGFINPVGVAVDPRRERLFVADSKAHHVKVFDLKGNLLETLGERGIEEGQFNFPTYVMLP